MKNRKFKRCKHQSLIWGRHHNPYNQNLFSQNVKYHAMTHNIKHEVSNVDELIKKGNTFLSHHAIIYHVKKKTQRKQQKYSEHFSGDETLHIRLLFTKVLRNHKLFILDMFTRYIRCLHFRSENSLLF